MNSLLIEQDKLIKFGLNRPRDTFINMNSDSINLSRSLNSSRQKKEIRVNKDNLML